MTRHEDQMFRQASAIAERRMRHGRVLQAHETVSILKAGLKGLATLVSRTFQMLRRVRA